MWIGKILNRVLAPKCHDGLHHFPNFTTDGLHYLDIGDVSLNESFVLRVRF